TAGARRTAGADRKPGTSALAAPANAARKTQANARAPKQGRNRRISERKDRPRAAGEIERPLQRVPERPSRRGEALRQGRAGPPAAARGIAASQAKDHVRPARLGRSQARRLRRTAP